MIDNPQQDLLRRIRELEDRVEESEQLISAIKAGEVDAFAIKNEDGSEIYTLQTGDYAYRLLIEEFGEGAINVSEDGLIVYTNPYFLNLLQLSYDKVVGAQIIDFVDPGSSDDFHALFRQGLAGRSKGEVNLKVNGGILPVYISLTSLQPNLQTVGIIITDLTEKKKNENTILEYQKNLENKNKELVQRNSELASFAYAASHDLQEPLRKIQTFASRIFDREFANLSENGRDHLNRMKAAARRMQTLIEDLLSYSRTNTGERIFVNTDLTQIIDEVRLDLKEELQEKDAVIEAKNMCVARIIPFQFRQLMHNLVSNSLKFTKPDQPPRITITSEITTDLKLATGKPRQKKAYCHISIADNGIGFEQEYSQKIFELFQRLHGRSEYDGTGIGLAIVKKIVENHDGLIAAHAEVDKGATFDIYIPA